MESYTVLFQYFTILLWWWWELLPLFNVVLCL